MSKVIAIAVADIHLSHNPPAARSAEPDWYAAMKRPLDELRALKEKYDVPILCAGDVFDKWHSPPELINFAIENMPEMYAVPGQHDLPNHNLDEIKRSAYWTLVEAGVIKGLGSTWTTYLDDHRPELSIWGFPWGTAIPLIKDRDVEDREKDETIKIAVAHSFIWKGHETGYAGAPIEKRAAGYKKQLKGYDLAIFGDNHQGFDAKSGDCQVWNCGTFMRRKIDEIDYHPIVGLVYSHGSIEPYCLDISQDKFIDGKSAVEMPELDFDITDFVNGLRSLDMDALDFRAAVDHYLDQHDVKKSVRTAVCEALEGE